MCHATIEKNTTRYKMLLGFVQKDRIDKLTMYMEKNTDVYSAPTSNRFHLACVGSLV